MATHTLQTPDVDLVYDVHGPIPTADGRPPLLMIGQPMDASGFAALVSLLPERTAVTYDPRGWAQHPQGRPGRPGSGGPGGRRACRHRRGRRRSGRAVREQRRRRDGPRARDAPPRRRDDARRGTSRRCSPCSPTPRRPSGRRKRVRDRYEADGWGAGMAAFIALTSWSGELTSDFFDQPAPDPAAFGLPTDDDGSRDDPLLSDRSWAITEYQPDAAALTDGADTCRHRRRRGVARDAHRAHGGGHRGAARAASRRVPQPSRWVPRRRVRLRRPTGGVRRRLRDVLAGDD